MVVVAIAGAGAGTAVGQVRLSSVEDVRRAVARGDAIAIVRDSGGTIKGKVLRVGDATLDIRADGEATTGQRRLLDVTIPWTDLVSLERPRDSSRNGALIGAGVGGGFWLAMFVYAAAVDYNEIDEWAPAYAAAGAISAGIGALAGWAIDRAHSKPHIRFEVPTAGRMTIRAEPLRSGRPGLAIVLSF
jgi:hypothetical protein